MSSTLASKDRKQNQPVSNSAGLLDYVARLAHHREGRRTTHLHLSQLAPSNRREHHIRIAMNTLEPLLRKFEGNMFRLWNDDLIFGTKDATAVQIADYVNKLRFLFSEDPLITAEAESGQEFSTIYDIITDYARLRRLVHDLDSQSGQGRKQAAEQQSSVAPQKLGAIDTQSHAITPGQLERFEAALRTADLIPMIQRQMICAVSETGKPKPVMTEFFVSIQTLQKKFLPGVDCASDRWLFQHLSQFLDYRMLVALPSMIKDVQVPVSINVNVNTLLSTEFLKFEAAMSQHKKLSLIFELQLMDIIGDMGGYIFARDFLRERNYGVALDGLTHLTFPVINGKKLNGDFQKIIWHPELAGEIKAERRADFIENIKQAGASRIVLCRCDDQRALDFGREAGIALFQGRHLDNMIAAG